jgi:hypothetical protein
LFQTFLLAPAFLMTRPVSALPSLLSFQSHRELPSILQRARSRLYLGKAIVGMPNTPRWLGMTQASTQKVSKVNLAEEISFSSTAPPSPLSS